MLRIRPETNVSRHAGLPFARYMGISATCLAALTLNATTPELTSNLPMVRLTLQQALKTALDQNPKVHQSVLNVALSQEERNMAASALLPHVDAQAFGQRAKNNLDAFIGIPSPHGPEVVGPFNWGYVGIEAKASLFDLSLWKRWKATQHGETSAREQARAVREEIAALVVGQYLRALKATESVKASQSRVDLAEALSKLAVNQQNQGVGTRLDTLRSQVQLQTERQRLIQAKTQLLTALAGLARLLDLKPGTHVELTDSLAAPATNTFTFQEAFETSLKQRPEMAALNAREKAADSLREAATSLRLPSLMLTGNYNSTGLQSQTWVPTYQIGVTLRVPLFTGGLVAARVAKAKAELAQVQDARKEISSQVGFEVQVAQAELDAAKNEVEVATLATTLANEALVQARHRYEAGVSNNIEVINAQDELARANDNHISALYRLNQANADLAKAMGRLEPLFAP